MQVIELSKASEYGILNASSGRTPILERASEKTFDDLVRYENAINDDNYTERSFLAQSYYVEEFKQPELIIYFSADNDRLTPLIKELKDVMSTMNESVVYLLAGDNTSLLIGRFFTIDTLPDIYGKRPQLVYSNKRWMICAAEQHGYRILFTYPEFTKPTTVLEDLRRLFGRDKNAPVAFERTVLEQRKVKEIKDLEAELFSKTEEYKSSLLQSFWAQMEQVGSQELPVKVGLVEDYTQSKDMLVSFIKDKLIFDEQGEETVFTKDQVAVVEKDIVCDNGDVRLYLTTKEINNGFKKLAEVELEKKAVWELKPHEALQLAFRRLEEAGFSKSEINELYRDVKVDDFASVSIYNSKVKVVADKAIAEKQGKKIEKKSLDAFIDAFTRERDSIESDNQKQRKVTIDADADEEKEKEEEAKKAEEEQNVSTNSSANKVLTQDLMETLYPIDADSVPAVVKVWGKYEEDEDIYMGDYNGAVLSGNRFIAPASPEISLVHTANVRELVAVEMNNVGSRVIMKDNSGRPGYLIYRVSDSNKPGLYIIRLP